MSNGSYKKRSGHSGASEVFGKEPAREEGKEGRGEKGKEERRRRADQSKINQIKVEIKSGVHLCFRAGTKF